MKHNFAPLVALLVATLAGTHQARDRGQSGTPATVLPAAAHGAQRQDRDARGRLEDPVQRFATLRERLVKPNAAFEAEGPDWWKTHKHSGGKAKCNEPPVKRKGRRNRT